MLLELVEGVDDREESVDRERVESVEPVLELELDGDVLDEEEEGDVELDEEDGELDEL